MKRRAFIALLGGAAMWPLAARAQQRERMRRIGVLMPYAANDPQSQARNAAFLQELQQLGWTVGHNVEIGAGAGRFASTVWRIGLMGHNARPDRVALVLAALQDALDHAA